MTDEQRQVREEIGMVFGESGIEGVRKFVLEHRSDPNYKNFLPKLDKAAEEGGKQGASDFIQDYLKNPNRTRQGTDVGYVPSKGEGIRDYREVGRQVGVPRRSDVRQTIEALETSVDVEVAKQTLYAERKTLMGNVDVLEEEVEHDEGLDVFPSEHVVYPDLVFTLRQDPTKYFRPGVMKRDGRLVIVTNPLFFRAAREAGIQNIMFDFIVDKDDVDVNEVVGKFGLVYPEKPKPVTEKNRFLFFKNSPNSVGLLGLDVRAGRNNTSESFRKNNCLQYVVGTDDTRNMDELVKRAVEQNGRLRSVDGITNVGPYKDLYF